MSGDGFLMEKFMWMEGGRNGEGWMDGRRMEYLGANERT